MTRNRLLFLPLTVFFILIFPVAVFAQSTCCHNHGGVCSCYCCDRTPLTGECEAELKACVDIMNPSDEAVNVLGTATSKDAGTIAKKTTEYALVYWVLAIVGVLVVVEIIVHLRRNKTGENHTNLENKFHPE
jgi:hypothetical protein